MKISEIKKENRPMEKMLKYGVESLSNEELLAILINCGTKSKSSLDISYEIINSVTDLSHLLNLSVQELMKFSGIKEAKACRIEAAFELTRRLMTQTNFKKSLILPSDSIKFIYPLIGFKETEHIVTIYLNSGCQIISYKIFEGNLSSINLPINEIVRKALTLNARGIIIAHNHPSGKAKASDFDIEATNDLADKLALFDIILFDHIIVGHNEYYSFNEDKIFSIETK